MQVYQRVHPFVDRMLKTCLYYVNVVVNLLSFSGVISMCKTRSSLCLYDPFKRIKWFEQTGNRHKLRERERERETERDRERQRETDRTDRGKENRECKVIQKRVRSKK